MSNNKQLQRVVGTGLVFPIQLDETGKAVLTTGVPLIQSSIKIILTWVLGTKLMQGAFGSLLLLYIEDPNDDILAHQVDYAVSNAVELWETRVKLLDTNIKQSDNGISLAISYKIIGTDITDTFIFPYYTKVLQ